MSWQEKRDREERIRNGRAEMLGISRAELDRLDPPRKRTERHGYSPLAGVHGYGTGASLEGRICGDPPGPGGRGGCGRKVKAKNSLGGLPLRNDPLGLLGLLCNGIVDETGERVDCYHARELEVQMLRDAQVERERRNAPEPKERKSKTRKPRAGQLSLVPEGED